MRKEKSRHFNTDKFYQIPPLFCSHGKYKKKIPLRTEKYYFIQLYTGWNTREINNKVEKYQIQDDIML